MKPKIVIIGGAGGIGSKIALRYARAGFTVIIGDVDSKKGKHLVHELANSAEFVAVDVLRHESIISFAECLRNHYGSVEHIISLAGRAIQGEFQGLSGSTFAIIDQSIQLNLTSHLILTKTLLPLIEESSAPNKSITFLSSVNAIMDFGLPAYSAAKAGLLGFVRSLCSELGKKNIRINAILPGSVDTALAQSEPKDMPALVRATTLGRIPTAEEIASVVFAVTELMTCITGQCIVADCGQSINGHN